MPFEEMSELLEEQYDVTEAYANAQTRLWNATQRQQRRPQAVAAESEIGGGNPSAVSVQQHYDALRNVQSNLRQLQLYANNSSNGHADGSSSSTLLLQQHVALTQRVLQTLAHNPCTWQSNGLPRQQQQQYDGSTGEGQDDSIVVANATVAMATLKASIARIRHNQ